MFKSSTVFSCSDNAFTIVPFSILNCIFGSSLLRLETSSFNLASFKSFVPCSILLLIPSISAFNLNFSVLSVMFFNKSCAACNLLSLILNNPSCCLASPN